MKNIIKFALISVLSIVTLYVLYVVLNLYTGWYGYEYWKYRSGTITIADSKKRKVFVKNLNYKITDSSNLKGFYFRPYIEKGFKYGIDGEDKTFLLKNSEYPYNLCYERGLRDSVAIYIKKGYENNIDSMDAVWGYLKKPNLRDTVYLEISSKHHKGTIKVW